MSYNNLLNQSEPAFGASDRYKLVNTQKIITTLEGRGFELEGVNAARVRKVENVDKQKHLVTMRYNAMATPEGVPTIIIQNSHNRSSGLKFYVGYIVFACLNGLVRASEGDVKSLSIRHSDGWEEKANDFVSSYVKDVELMNEEHVYMKMRTLTELQRRRFVEEAVKIRYKLEDVLDPNELTLVRRVEDRGDSMWNTYNKTQEALIHGLFQRRTRAEVDGKIIVSPWGKANRITSNDEIIRINQEVRELALTI